MCLSTILKIYTKPRTAVRFAVKEFDMPYANLKFRFYPLNGGFTVPRGVWLQAVSVGVHANTDKPRLYGSGFHAYVQGSDDYAQTPVLVRGITAKGMQSYREIYVAQEMYVPTWTELRTTRWKAAIKRLGISSIRG